MSLLEIVAVVVSFLAIWLTARRNMLCWPLNLIASGLYFKLFLDVRLYADMALQAAFCIGLVYGWVVWACGRRDIGLVRIVPLTRFKATVGLIAGAVGALVIGWFTSHHTDAALPWIDATLSSFSLVAQYWTARRHRQSWLIWIAVDVAYVGMFVVKGLMLTAGLYAVIVGLAVMGYLEWRQAPRFGQDDVTPASR